MADLKSHKGHEMGYLDGKPADLADEVARMKNVATTIEKLVALLGDVHDGKKSKSEKVDELKDTAGEAKKALAKAKDIYANTGAALGDYHTQLDTSVKAAKSAYDDAVELLPRLNKAETAYNAAVQHKNTVDNRTTTSPADQEKQKTDADAAETSVTNTHSTYTTLKAQMDGYKTAWDKAKDDLDHAADIARGKIKDAVDKNPSKDSWWDNLSSVLSAIASILGWVALALTIVAIFLTGPLALAFLAVATALTVVNLIIHSSLALTGKGSWMDVAFDLVGLIPFGKLLKGGSALSRLSATGRGLLDNLNVVSKFKNIRGLPTALNAAIARNAFSRSGNYWANWAANARQIAAGGPSRWNVWANMKAGGSAAYADMADTLANLPRRNVPARDAIDSAWALLGDKPSTLNGVVTSGQQLAGAGYSAYGSASGSDWTVSQITSIGDGSPSASDLKNRVMSPYMDGMPRPHGR